MPEPFTAIAARFSGVEKSILEAAADRFDIIATEAAARVVGNGGAMRMHGRNKKRPTVKMGTRSKVLGDGSMIVDGTPKGPWVWIESGTRAHEIGRPRGGEAVFLKGPSYGHPIKGPITHHGSTGRRAWTRAIETFRDEYPDIVISKVKEVTRGK